MNKILTWQERIKPLLPLGSDNRSAVKSKCMTEEIAELRKRLATLEQNSERYLFLRNQNIFEQFGGSSPYVIRGQSMTPLDGEELDQAVDRYRTSE